jgi:hypothetical protein
MLNSAHISFEILVSNEILLWSAVYRMNNLSGQKDASEIPHRVDDTCHRNQQTESSRVEAEGSLFSFSRLYVPWTLIFRASNIDTINYCWTKAKRGGRTKWRWKISRKITARPVDAASMKCCDKENLFMDLESLRQSLNSIFSSLYQLLERWSHFRLEGTFGCPLDGFDQLITL